MAAPLTLLRCQVSRRDVSRFQRQQKSFTKKDKNSFALIVIAQRCTFILNNNKKQQEQYSSDSALLTCAPCKCLCYFIYLFIFVIINIINITPMFLL